MLLDELLQFLPGNAGHASLTIAIGGLVIGVAAWVCGARFSRPIVTLCTVALGTAIGLYVPRHFGWSFNGAAPAIAMALILGVTGYTLHGLWVGVGLGSVLAFWAGLGCWIKFRGNLIWAYPTLPPHEKLAFISGIWHELPDDFTHILPLVAAAALICGVAFAILWPTASLLVSWSCAGATLLVMMGLALVRFGQPKLLSKLAGPLWAQLGALALLVAIGTLLNWWLGPETATEVKATSKAGKKKSPRRDDPDDEE